MENKSKIHTISFIIPVLNGEKYIGQCLDHILREMHDSDEIIVVDNGSTDDTLKIIKLYNKVKYSIVPEVTIAALRNRGADSAKGDILAFIDSDCLVCAGWREGVESVLSDKMIRATGSACDVPPLSTWVERAWWSLKRGTATKVNFINSGNFVIRNEIFQAVSGFNERLITDEDSDIGSRLNQKGYSILEAPKVRVIHMGNAKTLMEFAKKEKWHATSILSTMTKQQIDKPMIMTFIFMICFLFSLTMMPFFFLSRLNPIFIVFPLLLTPLATALYRIYQYKNYRYFFHLIILYFVFYVVRSITLIEVPFKKYLSKKEA